jgi:hypothetical protein
MLLGIYGLFEFYNPGQLPGVAGSACWSPYSVSARR